jgi:cellulose synthase/poly-beta-1,6-N-acetylglucosamine synthase-like glycosyltransferase
MGGHAPHLVPRPNLVCSSFVVPMDNEADVLPLLVRRLESLAVSLPCAVEWVVVNDGSRDGTAGMLAAWAERDPGCKFVDLARNFDTGGAHRGPRSRIRRCRGHHGRRPVGPS